MVFLPWKRSYLVGTRFPSFKISWNYGSIRFLYFSVWMGRSWKLLDDQRGRVISSDTMSVSEILALSKGRREQRVSFSRVKSSRGEIYFQLDCRKSRDANRMEQKAWICSTSLARSVGVFSNFVGQQLAVISRLAKQNSRTSRIVKWISLRITNLSRWCIVMA